MKALSKKHGSSGFKFARQVLVLFAVLLISLVHGQVVQTFNASGTYTVPAGVTRIVVECYGGGGRGGSRSTNGQGGGGGGGAYARSILTVAPGNNFTVTVGAGSTSGTTPGGDSWFGTSTTVMAKGGASVPDNNATGGAGGSAASSIGTVKFNGGNGGGVGSSTGGGGGASGGYGGPGGNGAVGTGGTALPGGGAGGAGGVLGAAGTAGTAPGGGGGGAAKWFFSGAAAGGNGATGRVVVSYYTPGSCMTSSITGINGVADNQCAASAYTSVPLVISGQPTTLGTAPGNARLVSVQLAVTQTFNGDMRYTLTSPTGTTRNLVLNRFGNGDNLGNPTTCATFLTLQDGGTALTNSNTSNVSGTYAPEQTLAGFTGNPNGAWLLNACDNATGDVGTIRYFQLNFCTVPQITASSSNSPICIGSPLTLSATATGSPAPTYSWAGTGTYVPNNTSANVTVNGATTGTYTVTATSSCGTTTANVPVVVNPLPTATASGGGTVCSDQPLPNVTFTFTGTPPYNFTYSGPGGGNVTGHNSNTYTIVNAAAGTYAVTAISDNNTCVGTSFGSSASVTVNPAATADAGGPYATCTTDPVTITATASGPGSWSGGLGVFGDATSTTTTYTADISEAGTSVTLTWTTTDPDGADPCGPVSDNATLVVNPLPILNCGTYGPTCVDAPDIVLSGSPSGGTWSGTGVTGNNFDPDAGTQTVTYTYTDGNGCTNSCQTTITVNPLPVVTCPADITDACTADAAFALAGNGENPTGGSFSGPGVSGGNFDPATAGAGTHTITYAYTDGNSCVNTCTFDITVTQATPWYSDVDDADGLGDPNDMVMACSQPVGYVADDTDLCPLVTGTVGSSCDDGNCFTTNDVLDATCVCAGDLVPCDNWTLTIEAGTNGGEISWQILEEGGPCVLASGSGYGNGSTNNINVCVPQGNCFNLTFNDAGGNGIVGGGWMLVDNNGRRILDNEDNGGCFATTTTTAAAFCNEPASAQTVIPIHCDKENWIITNTIIASADPAVSAQWGIGDQTDDGYQFWFTSTCGNYSRRIYRNHATSGGQGPANAVRATKLALATIVTNPLPVGELLNVRVRSRLNGVYGNWGPACRFRLDPNACTTTQLNSTVSSPNYSCGVSGKVVGASGNAGKIFADVVTSGGNPATHYRFVLAVPGEGYTRNVVSTNAACQLGIWQTAPLLCGTYTYEVRVQASFDGGTSYCPLGEVCNVTITNNQPEPFCTPTGGAMQQQAQTRSDNFDAGDFMMYPNPNRGDQLFLNISGVGPAVSLVTVDIYDSFGKRATTATLPVQDGQLNAALELPNDLAAGLYMVNITAGEDTRTERLVIQR